MLSRQVVQCRVMTYEVLTDRNGRPPGNIKGNVKIFKSSLKPTDRREITTQSDTVKRGFAQFVLKDLRCSGAIRVLRFLGKVETNQWYSRFRNYLCNYRYIGYVISNHRRSSIARRRFIGYLQYDIFALRCL